MQRDAWSSDPDTVGPPSARPPPQITSLTHRLERSPGEQQWLQRRGPGPTAAEACAHVRSIIPPHPSRSRRSRRSGCAPATRRAHVSTPMPTGQLLTAHAAEDGLPGRKLGWTSRGSCMRAAAQAHAHAVAVAQARAQAIAGRGPRRRRPWSARRPNCRPQGARACARTHREPAAKPPRPPQQRKAAPRGRAPPLHITCQTFAALYGGQNPPAPRTPCRARRVSAQTAERS